MGTIINVGTVSIGCLVGYLLRKRFPESLKSLMLQGIGLITIVVGLQMGLKTTNVLIPLGAILIGGIIGYLLRIEQSLNDFAAWIDKKIGSNGSDATFVEGFVTASLIFCVGPMTILGSINDGLQGDYQLLAIKSVLDGFTSIALTASLGIGVAFSIVTIIIIQGGLTVTAFFMSGLLTENVITETTATGGIIIVGLGLVILEIRKLQVANFLPALLITPLIIYLLFLLS